METNTEVIITRQPSLRPTFLTVLCILTFIGSGWGVYKGFSGYFTADMAAQIVTQTKDKIDDQMSDQSQPTFVKNMMGGVFSSMSADNIRKSSVVTLISSLLTLAGALMMWQLYRVGFYLYIVGILISVIVPMVIFGGGLIGLIGGGVSALVGIVFIVLYGVNLKYLVR